MRIKKGDNVKILTGRDRNKTGKVVRVLPILDRVVVEGVNLVTKHLRPKQAGTKGQRVRFPGSLPRSRVMLVCGKCGLATRVGMLVTPEKKYRQCKKCKSQID